MPMVHVGRGGLVQEPGDAPPRARPCCPCTRRRPCQRSLLLTAAHCCSLLLTAAPAAAFVFNSAAVLGAVLYKGPGAGGRRLGWRPIASVVFIRMILVPAVGELAC